MQWEAQHQKQSSAIPTPISTTKQSHVTSKYPTHTHTLSKNPNNPQKNNSYHVLHLPHTTASRFRSNNTTTPDVAQMEKGKAGPTDEPADPTPSSSWRGSELRLASISGSGGETGRRRASSPEWPRETLGRGRGGDRG